MCSPVAYFGRFLPFAAVTWLAMLLWLKTKLASNYATSAFNIYYETGSKKKRHFCVAFFMAVLFLLIIHQSCRSGCFQGQHRDCQASCLQLHSSGLDRTCSIQCLPATRGL